MEDWTKLGDTSTYSPIDSLSSGDTCNFTNNGVLTKVTVEKRISATRKIIYAFEIGRAHV